MANYGQAVIAAAQMFLDKVVMYPYIESKFAILALPDENGDAKVRFSIYGDHTEVRTITPGNSVNYNGSFTALGNSGSVSWDSFAALWDRQYTCGVDFITEMNSVLQGMSPSILALVRGWWRQQGAEIDACVATNLYSYVPNDTTHRLVTTSGADLIGASNIFNTLNSLKWSIFNSGVESKVYFFVSSDVAQNISTKLVTDYGLANPTVISMSPDVGQRVADRVGEKALEANLSLYKFGDNCYIIPVPKNRMYTKIILNDGTTTGQEAGGYAPASTTAGFANVKILAVPEQAAFVAIRHLVSNMTTPAGAVGLVNIKGKVDELNADYYGNATIQNIGIDQNSDQFKTMNRVLHGSGIFDVYTSALYSVTDAVVTG